jgi:serine protease AprX
MTTIPTFRAAAPQSLLALLLAAVLALASAPGLATTPPQGGLAPSVDRFVDAALQASATVPVIVQVRPGGEAAAMAAVERAGGQVTASFALVHGFSAHLPQAGLEALLALGDVVRAVTLDTPIRFGQDDGDWGQGSDTFYAASVGARTLHRRGVDGSGVGIAVIDTGVNEIADLAGRVTDGADFSSDDDGVDRYGHGTFVASIAAGDGTSSDGDVLGVAPGAHIVPVKIAGASGAADVSHILAAIQWVVSHKDVYDIGVMNLSFGTDSLQPQALDPLNYAVERAWEEGIVVVVAAANDGPDPRTIMKPADDPFVITVGATDSNGTRNRRDDTVPDFSSRGPTRADGFAKPDLVAPGTRVVGARVPGSTVDTSHPDVRIGEHHMRGSGTSFSAAVVSGAVALLRQAHPDWTPDAIKGALLSSAAHGPVGDPNVDGFGVVDVAAAASVEDPPLANQGAAKGTGLGLLEDSRGSLAIEIQTEDLLGQLITVLLTGDLTAQNELFDAVDYVTTDWTATTWYTSQWYTSQWYTSQWYTSQWYTSQWYTSQWYGAEWD